MPAYYQNIITGKINQYLKIKKRKLVLKGGYCHGITLLWLYSVSKEKEKWFFDTLKKIGSHIGNNFDAIELDIEKFLSHIEWLQNSSEYVFDIQQLDVGKLLEAENYFSLSYVFNHTQFNDTLSLLIDKNKLICLSGPNHSIGVVKKEDKFHVFDSNIGKTKICDSILDLKKEIIQSLFKNFKISSVTLPVLFSIVDTQKNESKDLKKPVIDKIKLFTSLINSDYKVNIEHPSGITPLYIASESGDEEEVKLLLSREAKPNHITDGYSPLHIAAQKGHANIVKRLLDHGADPNLLTDLNSTALHLATLRGQHTVVEVLLERKAKIDLRTRNGDTALGLAIQQNNIVIAVTLLKNKASPLVANYAGVTPLDFAINSKNWRATVLLLEYIKKTSDLNSITLQQLKKYNRELVEAIKIRSLLSDEFKDNPVVQKILKLKCALLNRSFASTRKSFSYRPKSEPNTDYKKRGFRSD